MARYMVKFDLFSLSGQLSQSLGCDLDPADVREILLAAGLRESPSGWLAKDLRPLALLYLTPRGSAN